MDRLIINATAATATAAECYDLNLCHPSIHLAEQKKKQNRREKLFNQQKNKKKPNHEKKGS